jgi:hypothetical protein
MRESQLRMTTLDTPLIPCTNCGGASSDYCVRCGERQPGHHDLSVAHFAHEVVHEFVHLDSKLFRTLRDIVIKPGFVTEEYFAGRKSRYIAPLRLFLTLFAVQFVAFTFYQPAAIFTVASMKRMDTAGALTRLINKRAVKLHLTPAEFEERLDERWHKNYSLLQLMNIVGLAVVLKVLHRKRYLAEHLVFAAHMLCFSYLLALVVDWPIYAVAGFHPGPLQRAVLTVTVGIQLVYLFIAQRRFYSGGGVPTAIKTVLLWIVGRWAVMVVLMGGSLFTAMVMVH